MTNEQKIIKNKLGLLKLAQTLGSVSQACKVMGFSRDSFYRFKELYDDGRRAGPARRSAARSPSSRTASTSASSRPSSGWRSSSRPTAKSAPPTNSRSEGSSSRPGGVRCIWLRHDLETFQQAAQGAVGEGGAGGLDPHRRPGPGAGEGQAGEGGARRDRDRAPGLSRLAGHLLRRHAKGRRAHLPADLHRHLHAGRRLPSSTTASTRSPPPTCSTTGCCRSSRSKACRCCAC